MIAIRSAGTAFMLALTIASATSAGAQSDQPAQSYRFVVTVEGEAVHDLGSWSKVSGLDVTWDLAEYRSEGAASVSRPYFPGLTKYSTVKLSRASSGETDLVLVWLRDVAATGDSPMLRITLLDETGEAVLSWQVVNVVPRNFTIGGLESEGTDVAIETLVLAHEGISIVCVSAC